MADANRNQHTEAALHYHECTKHSEESLRADPHFLDFDNQPVPFKIYTGVESVPLIRDPDVLDRATPPTLEAISLPVSPVTGETAARLPDLAMLSQVLFLAAGITKRKRHSGGEIYFRAYPNTGGLYHIDVYLVAGDLSDLPAGVYHFGPHDFSLHRLRAGDYRTVLVEASGQHPGITRAPVTLVSASTYWRNAWKYRARAYRHCFWDSGTLHANLLAVAAAQGLRPSVVMGFSDAAVETLLGLDPMREGALTLVPLGRSNEAPPAAPALHELELKTSPLSPAEIDYPLIRTTHVASSLGSGVEVNAWRWRYARSKGGDDKRSPAAAEGGT